jgi:hypothetical protein
VELIRFGRPVDEDAAVKVLVPDVSQESVTMFDWIEDPEGLKLHHLFVNWKERGAVDFRNVKEVLLTNCVRSQDSPASGLGTPANGIPSVGVLWWIAPGESLSFSADVAATVHKRSFGCMPSVAWVKKLPAKAQSVIEVGEGDDHVMLELRTGDWVPERFVVVGNPSVVSRRDAEPTQEQLGFAKKTL